jgi:hypothetical protein
MGEEEIKQQYQPAQSLLPRHPMDAPVSDWDPSTTFARASMLTSDDEASDGFVDDPASTPGLVDEPPPSSPTFCVRVPPLDHPTPKIHYMRAPSRPQGRRTKTAKTFVAAWSNCSSPNSASAREFAKFRDIGRYRDRINNMRLVNCLLLCLSRPVCDSEPAAWASHERGYVRKG